MLKLFYVFCVLFTISTCNEGRLRNMEMENNAQMKVNAQTNFIEKQRVSGEQHINAATKLYVGNLPWRYTDLNLREIFGEYGTVREATVVRDRFSGYSKGFGFVTMATSQEAASAIVALNDKEFDGRRIQVKYVASDGNLN